MMHFIFLYCDDNAALYEKEKNIPQAYAEQSLLHRTDLHFYKKNLRFYLLLTASPLRLTLVPVQDS